MTLLVCDDGKREEEIVSQVFSTVDMIQFEGSDSANPLSYRYYDPKRKVLGKTMEEQCRFAVCYWHTLCWHGSDAFGGSVFNRPWEVSSDPLVCAKAKADAMFELVGKLQLPFFTFHDRDVAPEQDSIKVTNNFFVKVVEYLGKKIQDTGIELLWGTANLFSHPRYMAGAATNPDPEVFAFAAMQVKHAMDATKQLDGKNYVLWGGREGYDTLLNTDLKKEADQLARFLTMVADYKHKIGLDGYLLLEPKPCEPTKHQYDFDTATVFAFLQKYGLEKEFKVNIEGNHATLAGHSFEHEVAYACANDLFGSIDANQGDPQLGWDTDQFPIDPVTMTKVMTIILENGGFKSGGFNFDTKIRRQSIDLADLFYGHIAGVDTIAFALLAAEKTIKANKLAQLKQQRYAKWNDSFGQKIMRGDEGLSSLAQYAEQHKLDPKPISGQQELLELIANQNII